MDYINKKLNIKDSELTEDLLVYEYLFDAEAKRSTGIATIVFEQRDALIPMVLDLIKNDFPEPTEEQAGTVLAQLVLDYKEGHFIDSLSDAIEKRKKKINEDAKNIKNEFKVDTTNWLVQPEDIKGTEMTDRDAK